MIPRLDDMYRPFAAVLLIAYSGLIASLTLSDPSTGAWAFSFADRLATSASDGNLAWSQTEVLANIALFVPAGFLLALVLNRPWVAAALCILGSVLIEYVQARYLPLRVGTGADVLHNGYGAVLGAALAWPFTAMAAASAGRASLLRSADRSGSWRVSPGP